MKEVSRTDLGAIPAGTRWCAHCNGYGSSLKEASGRCTRCGGTGLVAVADPGAQRPHRHEPDRLGRVR